LAGAVGGVVSQIVEGSRVRATWCRRGWQVGPGGNGPDGQFGGGGRERVRESEAVRQRVLTCGPDQHSAGRRGLNWIQWYSPIETDSETFKFDWFEKYLPKLQKCEIKYDWKEYEMGMNSTYTNFLRFLLHLNKNAKNFIWVEIEEKFTGISWNFGFHWNLARKLIVKPYCKEK
jgi:hypothetical protein